MTDRVKTTGGPAYPIEAYITTGHMQAEGMSLRFRTAIAAMQSLIISKDTNLRRGSVRSSGLVSIAFEIADEMLLHAEETDPLPYDASTGWE